MSRNEQGRTPTGVRGAADGGSGAEPVAGLHEVVRRYGDTEALAGVSLDFARGQLVGVLGPNGAGKSTIVSLLTGLRRPTSGTVRVFGRDPRDPVSRRAVGVTPQQTGLPDNLKVREVVDFVRAHHTDPLARDEVLERFGLTDLAGRRNGSLSGGQKRRLAVALAFVGRPELVFLDEPTTGLDIEARHQLWGQVRAFHEQGGTVVLTSHYLEEVEALAQRVVVLGQGRVVADDSVQQVRGLVEVSRVTLRAPVRPDLPGVSHLDVDDDGRYTLTTADPDQLVRDLVRSDSTFSELEIRPSSLEEAFLSLA